MMPVQIACAELCQNPADCGAWRSVLSERQIPQVIGFSRKLPEKEERLDRAFVRPRQVRYQAIAPARALRRQRSAVPAAISQTAVIYAMIC
jgi:hypothetical protein